MTKRRWTLVLALLAACTAELEDAELEETTESGAEPTAESVEVEHAATPPNATNELVADDDPLAACKCVQIDECSLRAQGTRLECDWPQLEPVDPFPPIGPVTPIDPWVPLEEEPQLDRLAGAATSTTGLHWPPPNCHEVPAEVVQTVQCTNRCSDCGLEDCINLDTGELSSHAVVERPDELFDCETVAWVPCNELNVCS